MAIVQPIGHAHQIPMAFLSSQKGQRPTPHAALIEYNLGIGFVPELLALPLLEEKKLVQIPLGCNIPKRSIQIISDKERGKSLAADTFYKYLKVSRL